MIVPCIQKHTRLLIGLVCCTYLIDCSLRQGLTRIERKTQHAIQTCSKKQQALFEHLARLRGTQTLPTNLHERQQTIINTLLQTAHKHTIDLQNIIREKNPQKISSKNEPLIRIECSGTFANLYATLTTLAKTHPDIQYQRCTFTNTKGTIHHVLTLT